MCVIRAPILTRTSSHVHTESMNSVASTNRPSQRPISLSKTLLCLLLVVLWPSVELAPSSSLSTWRVTVPRFKSWPRLTTTKANSPHFTHRCAEVTSSALKVALVAPRQVNSQCAQQRSSAFPTVCICCPKGKAKKKFSTRTLAIAKDTSTLSSTTRSRRSLTLVIRSLTS